MDEKEKLTDNSNNERKYIILHKGKLKTLNSEIEEMEGQVAREIVIVAQLTQTYKISALATGAFDGQGYLDLFQYVFHPHTHTL